MYISFYSPVKSERNDLGSHNGILSPMPFGSFTEKPAGIKILHIDTRPLLLPKGMPATGHKVFYMICITH